jgi:NifU-like protein involved in Fe-S cluster formation
VELGATTQALEAMLKDPATASAAWPELAMFRPARAYPSRHKCALLPFHAVQAALRAADAAQ